MLFSLDRSADRQQAPRLLALCVVALAIACLEGLPAVFAAESPAAATNAAEAFPFEALDGSAIEFDTSARCHVIAFLGAGCPVARQYAGRLEEIAAKYADHGVRVIGVDTDANLDPATLVETGRVPVTLQGRPISRINELEWIEGEVFANLWQTDYIISINPTTGAITGIIDLTDLMPDRSGLDPTDAVLNGIAWDPEGRRLFVTGKNWPKLFEIRLTGPR